MRADDKEFSNISRDAPYMSDLSQIQPASVAPPSGAGAANSPANSPANPPAKPPAPPVSDPVDRATLRPRHKFLGLSFAGLVIVPLLVTAIYLWVVAADQYASHLGFSVRTEESSSAIELLGGITELSGSSSSDTDILYAYLTSQELVRKIDDAVDLRAIWSRVPYSRDPLFAYDPPGTIEELLSHWERKVTIVYDSGTGMIDLRILAFAPEDAILIAEALLEECTAMINNLSALAREDAVRYAREELEAAVVRLKEARRAMTEFRNRTQIVDPAIDTQNQMGLLTTLQGQMAEALIELDLLSDTTRESDPRIVQAQRRIEVIQERINAERRKLGLGGGADTGEVFATLVGEYEGLLVDREFAESAYTAALASYDVAQAEARKQSRYLAAHVRPTRAEKSQYPERGKIIALMALFLSLGWAIAALIYYSLRDRS
jgi:capsular polysaccharide transport system permease protein